MTVADLWCGISICWIFIAEYCLAWSGYINFRRVLVKLESNQISFYKTGLGWFSWDGPLQLPVDTKYKIIFYAVYVIRSIFERFLLWLTWLLYVLFLITRHYDDICAFSFLRMRVVCLQTRTTNETETETVHKFQTIRSLTENKEDFQLIITRPPRHCLIYTWSIRY